MKNISKRIEAITSLSSDSYDEIWDLCCDHGKIGIDFAIKYSPKVVHFIDQVPSIIENLKANLPFIENVSFNVQCIGCEDIQINETSKNLIVFAGVGSETIIKALKNLKTQNLGTSHLLISTHKHPHKLRMFLRAQKFSLIKEILIYEAGQFYEMLLVETKNDNEISLVGSKMWNFSDLDHLNYCNQLFDYYEIKLRHGKIEVQDLFNGLSKIKQSFKIT